MSKRSVEEEPDRRLETVGSYSAPATGPEAVIEDELRRAERLVLEGERAGLDDLEMGMRLGDMVRICFARQAWAEAVSPLTRLLALNRAQGEDRAEVATVLSSLAAARYALGEHNEAAQLWEEALGIRERWLVPNHFMIARSVENLADARVAQGRMDEALALLRRALAIWQQTLPPSDPTVRAIRTKIGDLQLLASQELPGRAPAGTRPSPTFAPARFGDYSREPMGPQGVQSSREVGSGAPVVSETPREPDAHHSAAGPPAVAAPVPGTQAAARLSDTIPAQLRDDFVLRDSRPNVEPATLAPPAAESTARAAGSPFALPFLVDLDAPHIDVPHVDDEPAPEDSARPPLSTSWLKLGRAIALSVPESPADYPPPPHEEPPGPPSGGFRAPHLSRAATLGGVALIAVLFGAYKLAGSESPPSGDDAATLKRVAAQTSTPARASGAARAPLVRTTSAGTVALPADRRGRNSTRVVPDETETATRAASRQDSRASDTRGEASDASRAGANGAALKAMPAASSADLANTMRAVESTTVVGSDSAVRQMLYGRALGLSTESDLGTARRGVAPSAPRPAAEEPHDMKPAMLAPGGPQPVFPFQLLSENVTGSVVVEVLVDATGRADVSTSRVVRSSHPLFTAAVMRALPSMRFVPAEAHGQKVAQRIEVPFRFDRKVAGQ